MVEIVPKSSEKENGSTGFLFFFSLFFLFASIIAYFVFLSLQKKAEASIQNLQERLAKEKTAEIEALEKTLQDYEKRLRNIEPLLKEHVFTSKLFAELEKNTHPQVFFYHFDLDCPNLTVTLKGKSKDFFSLGQQILILEKNPKIANPTLEQLSLDQEKMVDFVLRFQFSPDLIKINLK